MDDLGTEASIWEAIEAHLTDDWWNETIRLLLAVLERRSGPLLKRLRHAGKDNAGKTDWSKRGRGLALAMGGLQDLPPMLVSQEVRQEVMGGLQELTTVETRVPLRDRIEALLALGRVGDPRLGAEKEERWVWVSLAVSSNGGRGETAQTEGGFWLGKYPVTNQEYRAFMEAGGYAEEGLSEWWSFEGREVWSALRERRPHRYMWEGQKYWSTTEPAWWRDSSWNGPNQPVVGVSWCEAEAYCRWLTDWLANAKPTWWKPGMVVRLPSEEEWGWAARGADGRQYPWGGTEPTVEFANYRETGIGRTTPVGVHPKGGGPFGAQDQAGNVWEWCKDQIASCHRALRGGAWNSDSRLLRASFRNGDRPAVRDQDVGFRVVCVLSPNMLL